jgi:hypothetical protein
MKLLGGSRYPTEANWSCAGKRNGGELDFWPEHLKQLLLCRFCMAASLD